jgi:hypothetical protein
MDRQQKTQGLAPKDTQQEMIFSAIYSIVLGLVLAFISIVMLISNKQDSSGTDVLFRFLLILFISSILIFVLRIVAKRGMQIFSIILFAIFIATYLFLLILVPIQGKMCRELGGLWEKDPPITHTRMRAYLPRINYTCFVNNQNKSRANDKPFPYNLMKFEVKN